MNGQRQIQMDAKQLSMVQLQLDADLPKGKTQTWDIVDLEHYCELLNRYIYGGLPVLTPTNLIAVLKRLYDVRVYATDDNDINWIDIVRN